MMSFLNVKDVQRILNVKQATAYEVIRKLNAQLTMQGYQVVRGRVDKSYFEKSYLYSDSREKVTG
ncbi:ICEBs1 excisionase [Bacillus safensis]|uniref:ICEBs1 excisionase n=2 Tax=Bacillaceae TaxID=186817 RepID=A0AAD0HLQ6_BACPU|nr:MULTISPECIES: ICEBs1 excisionase [Bacillus]PRS37408.1 ICEBs1 excisionase [Bacillus sp. NMCC4]PRS74229.1 ICEBs1 excisionase [Bacillus sp. GBSW2]APT49036.1 ICEBs1 excisionase [Bacillus safensis]APT54688.1 ICEBs1 excisionase [Bacillus safensis]AVM23301.1 ICEBs1 excisionase [Bacillus pumilus]